MCRMRYNNPLLGVLGLGVFPRGAHVLRARRRAAHLGRGGLRRRGVTFARGARGRRSGLSTRHSLGRLAVAGPERGGPPARGARQAGRQLRSTAARRSVRAGGDARRLRDGHARPADAVTLALLEALSCPTSPSRSSFVWIPLVWFRSRPTRRRRARPPLASQRSGATHPGIPRLSPSPSNLLSSSPSSLYTHANRKTLILNEFN